MKHIIFLGRRKLIYRPDKQHVANDKPDEERSWKAQRNQYYVIKWNQEAGKEIKRVRNKCIGVYFDNRLIEEQASTNQGWLQS